MAIIISGPSLSFASNQKDLEAAFIYRFMHFLPGEKVSKQYYLCVHSADKIFNSLHKRLNNSRIFNGKLYIVNVKKDFKECSMVFLNQELASSDKKNVIAEIQNNGLFVVSKNGLNRDMAMIDLVVNDSSVKFDVNKTLMEKFNLSLSSKVLRLAKRVY